MYKKNINSKIIFIWVFITFLLGNSQELIKLEKLSYKNVSYVNLNEFMNVHDMHSKYYETKDKIEILYKKNKIYLSPPIIIYKNQ